MNLQKVFLRRRITNVIELYQTRKDFSLSVKFCLKD